MRRVLLLLTVLAMFLPGCTSDDGESTVEPTSFEDISIRSFAFQGGNLQVPVGGQVTWTNNDAATHTVTADAGLFDSGDLPAGGTFSFVFETPGTYEYHCDYHASMTGRITVA